MKLIKGLIGFAAVVVVAAVAIKVFAPEFFDSNLVPAINALIKK